MLCDGGAGFVDGDACVLDALVFEAGGGESFGEGFDEVAWRAGDDVCERVGEGAVVDGVPQVVGGGGFGGGGGEGDVDDEVLACLSFVVEHAVASVDAQA